MGRNLGPLNIKDSYEGLVQISGSDQLTDGSGSLISSLDVSASFATSASYASNFDTPTLQEVTNAGATTTDSIVINNRTYGGGAITTNVGNTALTIQGGTVDSTLTLQGNDNTSTNSIKLNPTTGVQISGSVDSLNDITAPNFIGTASFATSASFATTASLALALEGGVSLQSVLDIGNNATGSIVLKNDEASLPALQINSPIGTSSTLLRLSRFNDDSSNFVVSAGDATNATLSMGNNVGYGQINLNGTGENKIEATTQLSIDTPSLTLTGNITGSSSNVNVNSITASFASFTSASIGSLRTVTGSAVIIGDEFIILNADTPTARYAGLVVYDSGSATTASFEWDGEQDVWIQVDEAGNSGVMLTGPEGTKGAETFLTLNTIPKGTGTQTLADSSITDDGTTTSVSSRFETANANASGINSTATGNGTTASGNQASVIGGFSNNASGVQAFIAGGGLSSVTQQRGAVIGGYQHIVGAEDSVIIGGFNSDVLATHARSVVLGGTALATSKADEVVVPHLTISGSTIATDISASGYISASEFIGDGSGLTGVGAFPYTGSAEITGSLIVTGSTSIKGDLTAVDNNGQATILGVEGNVGNASNFTITTGGKNGANSATGENAASIGGQLHTNNGGQSFIGGGRNNDINGAQRAVILAGNDNTISGGNDDGYGIYNGKSNVINSNGGRNTTILGGATNTIRNFWSAADDVANGYPREMYGLIAGGLDNQIGQASGNTGANGLPLIIGGVYNKIGETTVDNTIFTKYNTIINSSGSATDSGSFQGVIGGYENYISGSDNAYIIASNNSTIDTHNNSVIIGGSGLTTTKDDEVVVPNLTISGSGAVLTFADGTTQTSAGGGPIVDGDGTNSARSSQHSASTAPNTNDLNIGGSNNTIANTNVGNYTIVGGTGNNIASPSFGNASIFGSKNGTITRGSDGTAMLGGINNSLTDTNNWSSVMLGGSGNTLNGGGKRRFMLGGEDNTMGGGNDSFSGIIGGENNTLTGHERSVIIGGDTLSTTKSDEVVVPNLTTNGAVVQNVEALTIATNVAEIDASLGNLFTLTLQNGVNTELQLTNQSAGQTFQVQITNNATGAGTISFDSQFDFEGGTAFTATATTSAVDILTFVCFGGGNVQCVGAKNFS